ncbi:dihydrofolate reductase family protein, partial [Nonomuraea sp. NPDC051941]|uniref:dihydrofolate reductase family protein n=1 Tax=Nonomuraea sp. NPDC051941 TaxID=3364373 RepID=UPI0037C7879F
MSGSVSVVRQLLAAGLLDELHLLVHPIAVRKGERLFPEGESSIPLELIKSETFTTGVLYLVYRPAKAGARPPLVRPPVRQVQAPLRRRWVWWAGRVPSCSVRARTP